MKSGFLVFSLLLSVAAVSAKSGAKDFSYTEFLADDAAKTTINSLITQANLNFSSDSEDALEQKVRSFSSHRSSDSLTGGENEARVNYTFRKINSGFNKSGSDYGLVLFQRGATKKVSGYCYLEHLLKRLTKIKTFITSRGLPIRMADYFLVQRPEAPAAFNDDNYILAFKEYDQAWKDFADLTAAQAKVMVTVLDALRDEGVTADSFAVEGGELIFQPVLNNVGLYVVAPDDVRQLYEEVLMPGAEDVPPFAIKMVVAMVLLFDSNKAEDKAYATKLHATFGQFESVDEKLSDDHNKLNDEARAVLTAYQDRLKQLLCDLSNGLTADRLLPYFKNKYGSLLSTKELAAFKAHIQAVTKKSMTVAEFEQPADA